MLCENPFIQAMQAHPCGRCMACLRKRKRIWTHRILLEQSLRSDNAFVTLTYAEDEMPAGFNLRAKDLQDWLKRFRKSIAPLRVRYFAVGEYGDESQRPHYHLALFGYPSCACHLRNLNRPTRLWVSCDVCDLLRNTWGRGIVHNAQLELRTAAYVAGYVTKKMTHRYAPELRGREPEFARMSLKPGIGYGIVRPFAQSWQSFNLEATQGDVPVTLRTGEREMPLGRYLRRKMRLMLGKEEGAPQHVLDQAHAEMRALYLASLRDPSFVSIKTALVEKDTGTRQAAYARDHIFKKRSSI